MQIIIDGYNYIFRGAKSEDAELESRRQGLIQKLASYAAARNIRITVVFDGQRPGTSPDSGRGKVKVVFSRPPENADAVIKRMVQSHKQPRDVLVVTSDLPLARFASSCGCLLLSSEGWRQKMEQGGGGEWQEKYDAMNSANLQEWLRLFEERPADPD